MRARLERATDIIPDASVLGLPRAKVPPLEVRAPYVRELELVLRDYERLLDQILDSYDAEFDHP